MNEAAPQRSCAVASSAIRVRAGTTTLDRSRLSPLMTAVIAAMIGTHSVSPMAAAIAEMTLAVMRMRTALLERAGVAVWTAHLRGARLPALDCIGRLLPGEAGDRSLLSFSGPAHCVRKEPRSPGKGEL